MFDEVGSGIGLWPGESTEAVEAEDRLAYEITCRGLADGWEPGERQFLPDIESVAPGPFLGVLLEHVDRSRLNGFDLVRVVRARERMVSHCQAEGMADVVEMSYAASGGADSDPGRLVEAFGFAADELRPALCLTRRSAEFRMSFAVDLRERLPRVWEMLSEGLVDLARARVICNGTAHLDETEAGRIVDEIAEKAPRLTTGQLAAWIRRLGVESDPEKAKKRVEHAVAERRLVIEPTVDGTANLHLLDIPLEDARAIGKRVNSHMFSLRRDGDDRSHDSLRADIATDFLLGSDPSNGGRGLFDMRAGLATLAGLDEKAAEIPGMGPVIADIARKFADQYPNAIWQATITDDDDRVVGVVTTSRRPTRRISRIVNATQPQCSFPGCRAPAEDCDFDHLLPWHQRGSTSTTNGGPKCRHDHTLRDHGWKHQRHNRRDVWTSPLGHTYTTEKPP
jgi:hypothetical protein